MIQSALDGSPLEIDFAEGEQKLKRPSVMLMHNFVGGKTQATTTISTSV